MVAGCSGLSTQVSWLDVRVGGHLALSLLSSNEPGELSQWPRHDDSTIDDIPNIIIVIIMLQGRLSFCVFPFV